MSTATSTSRPSSKTMIYPFPGHTIPIVESYEERFQSLASESGNCSLYNTQYGKSDVKKLEFQANINMKNKDDDTIKGTGQAQSSSAVVAASTNKPKSKRLCKEISCPKFRQGKCNGYCVACFQKFGATTCRDPHCINKIHKDGYCVSHFASVDGDIAIAAKPVSVSATKKSTKKKAAAATKPTKPVSEPATKTKKATVAAKPAKPVKRKRDYRE
eukprot:scaffold34640_cov106-Skeletonema_dohrnii-CCMP3373.AAC.2